jgi:hypothetical protein
MSFQPAKRYYLDIYDRCRMTVNGRSRAVHAVALRARRRLLQFLPFNFAEASIQRLPCGHQTRPCLDADELNAGFLVRVHKASIVLKADVGPQIIQDRFHKRQSIWNTGKETLGFG